MKKKQLPTTPNTYTSPLQTQATDISQGERQTGNQTLGTATSSLARFAPDATGNSPFYRALLNKNTSATAASGENALARSRENAQAAGFGGLNPLTYGAENALRNQQASRVAAIPGETLLQSTQPEMQAAGMLAGIGQGQLSNASGYFNQAAGMEDQRLNEFYKQQEEARKRKSGIWGALGKIGMGALGAIPGGGTAGTIFRGAAGGL